MDEHTKLYLSLAARVADGQRVDWDEALRSASDENGRRLIGQLRVVEQVSLAHGSGGSISGQRVRPSASSGEQLDETTTLEEAGRAGPRGARWAHLELREKLGEGGFGKVYSAWDPRLEREVALKLLEANGAEEKSVASKVVEEGRLLAKLRHPNVVTVFGAEIHEGRVGLWMERIRGRSLEQVLGQSGPFGGREAAVIGIDLCRALAAVHRAGVVHGDIKAQNAMREEGGRIVLMDFGAGLDMTGAKATEEGRISGTPFYMAPEMLSGTGANKRTDIYSLGVLLYRLVTATFPIEAASWRELREKHERHDLVLLRDRRSDLPDAFVKVVERAMSHDPEARYTTAGQMEQALGAAFGMEASPSADAITPGIVLPLEGRTQSWNTRVLAVAGLVAAAAIVGGFFVLVPVMKRNAPAGASGTAELPAGAAGSITPPQGSTAGPDPRAAGSSPLPAPPAGGQDQAMALAPGGAGSYTVKAALYRTAGKSAKRERLDPGARLSLGDRLSLEFEASAPLHVYVIDEDEEGHAYALFPLPGLEPRNPLPPGTTHVLPGERDGKQVSWTVDTRGGREHLMVLASPSRLLEFEAEMNALARPGQEAVSLPESARIHLRGIGGLSEERLPREAKGANHLFEMAQRLASSSEVVKGVWMRRIDLDNP